MTTVKNKKSPHFFYYRNKKTINIYQKRTTPKKKSFWCQREKDTVSPHRHQTKMNASITADTQKLEIKHPQDHRNWSCLIHTRNLWKFSMSWNALRSFKNKLTSFHLWISFAFLFSLFSKKKTWKKRFLILHIQRAENQSGLQNYHHKHSFWRMCAITHKDGTRTGINHKIWVPLAPTLPLSRLYSVNTDDISWSWQQPRFGSVFFIYELQTNRIINQSSQIEKTVVTYGWLVLFFNKHLLCKNSAPRTCCECVCVLLKNKRNMMKKNHCPTVAKPCLKKIAVNKQIPKLKKHHYFPVPKNHLRLNLW